MKAHIERDFATRGVRIWLAESGPREIRVLRLFGHDQFEWEILTPGQKMPDPTLILTDEALGAIVREASNILPVSDATTRHLDDAIATRDRLLALVEKRK